MRNPKMKKAQSKINAEVRRMNRALETDNLWRGRFFLRQTDMNWEEFEDGSGGCLTVWIEIRDKKTGLYRGFITDNYDLTYRIFEQTDKFITEESGVWKNINDVKNDKTDWSKVEWKPVRELYR